MPELTLSTIERTRRDIAELRRGLSDLFLWLDSRQATFANAFPNSANFWNASAPIWNNKKKSACNLPGFFN
jgi:hypothetical protein